MTNHDPIHIDDVTPAIIGSKVRDHLLGFLTAQTDEVRRAEAVDLSFWCGMCLGQAMNDRAALEKAKASVTT